MRILQSKNAIVTELSSFITQLYSILQPYCIAIYLGGSYCEDIIENPHDIDFICFSKTPREANDIRRLIYRYSKVSPLPKNYDFIQLRNSQIEERAYGSYINKRMIKLIGEDINFEFDVIEKDRAEYLQILKTAIIDLQAGRVQNPKR